MVCRQELFLVPDEHEAPQISSSQFTSFLSFLNHTWSADCDYKSAGLVDSICVRVVCQFGH
jgi:hypothetical protein